jgi:hypothetical protein
MMGIRGKRQRSAFAAKRRRRKQPRGGKQMQAYIKHGSRIRRRKVRERKKR